MNKENKGQIKMKADFNMFDVMNEKLSETYKRGTLCHHEGKYVPIRTLPKIGRNSLCQCGSGLKYKRCCIIEKNL